MGVIDQRRDSRPAGGVMQAAARDAARTRIGYLIPEYPGQTHIFFWRELNALREGGMSVDVVSTRRPARGIISHTWAAEEAARTFYLSPPDRTRLAQALGALVRATPFGWLRCLRSIASAEGYSPRGRIRLLALMIAGAELAAHARARGWDHLHVHSCADAANVALFAHLLSGLPYSLTLHGPLSDYGPNQREKWRHAQFAIVITHLLLDEVRTRLGAALPPRVSVAPMGVDLERFRRSRPYVAWREDEPARVFTCGRLNPCKGHTDLIDAVAALRARGIDATLRIAGEDEAGGTAYHRDVERFIADRGMEAHVTLLGAVSEETVRAGIEESHVFALASLQEPLGVAIMEAMALTTPVVVTGAGGVPELVTDGEDGLLVPPRDPQTLSEAIERVLRDPTLAERLGEAGRTKVARSFHSNRSAQVLMEQIRR